MAEKVTLKQFGEKLKEYSNGSAARKAIGRFNGWDDADKAKARKMIDAHFGVAEVPAKPTAKTAAKKAAPAKGTKAPKAAKAAAKAVTPKGKAPAPAELGGLDSDPVAMLPNKLAGRTMSEAEMARSTAFATLNMVAMAVNNLQQMNSIQVGSVSVESLVKLNSLQSAAIDILEKHLPLNVEKESVPTGRKPRATKAKPVETPEVPALEVPAATASDVEEEEEEQDVEEEEQEEPAEPTPAPTEI